MKTKSLLISLLTLAIVALAWSKDLIAINEDAAWERGQSIYTANCAACHNQDPEKDGALGPALKGSSEELLEHRVLGQGYPQGYVPKRATKLMPTFPTLKAEIPYLAIYLR